MFYSYLILPPVRLLLCSDVNPTRILTLQWSTQYSKQASNTCATRQGLPNVMSTRDSKMYLPSETRRRLGTRTCPTWCRPRYLFKTCVQGINLFVGTFLSDIGDCTVDWAEYDRVASLAAEHFATSAATMNKSCVLNYIILHINRQHNGRKSDVYDSVPRKEGPSTNNQLAWGLSLPKSVAR